MESFSAPGELIPIKDGFVRDNGSLLLAIFKRKLIAGRIFPDHAALDGSGMQLLFGCLFPAGWHTICNSAPTGKVPKSSTRSRIPFFPASIISP